MTEGSLKAGPSTPPSGSLGTGPSTPPSGSLGTALRVAVAVSLTAYILWRADPAQVLRAAASADWRFMAAAIALVLVDRGLMAYRWMVLLSALSPGTRPPSPPSSGSFSSVRSLARSCQVWRETSTAPTASRVSTSAALNPQHRSSWTAPLASCPWCWSRSRPLLSHAR